MRVTVITCTGDRPQVFELCKRWVKSQTVQPFQWIIVDDGVVDCKYMLPEYAQYVRRFIQHGEPKHTLCLNLKEALKWVIGDCVVIMEDDDYYSPDYIQSMVEKLYKYEVVGIGKSRYYHLPTGGYFRDVNIDHASLAQTAWRSSFIPQVEKIIDGDFYIDVRLWRNAVNGNGLVFDDGLESPLYLGMKGLPGRKGIGIGHNTKTYYSHDKDRSVLKKWCPNDYKTYLELLSDPLAA